MWKRPRNTHVLLHVRANGDSPVSLAMTHMRWLRGQSGRESTDYTQSVLPLCRWVGKRGAPTSAQTGTRANMNVRPRHLVNKQQDQDQRKTSRKDKKKHKMINPWKSKRDCLSRVAKTDAEPTRYKTSNRPERRDNKKDHDTTMITTEQDQRRLNLPDDSFCRWTAEGPVSRRCRSSFFGTHHGATSKEGSLCSSTLACIPHRTCTTGRKRCRTCRPTSE